MRQSFPTTLLTEREVRMPPCFTYGILKQQRIACRMVVRSRPEYATRAEGAGNPFRVPPDKAFRLIGGTVRDPRYTSEAGIPTTDQVNGYGRSTAPAPHSPLRCLLLCFSKPHTHQPGDEGLPSAGSENYCERWSRHRMETSTDPPGGEDGIRSLAQAANLE